jgi:hypothetical protein
VQWLLEHVEDVRHEPLTAQWEGTYKLRVGDYRVMYAVDQIERCVIIYAVGHRREIYKLRRVPLLAERHVEFVNPKINKNKTRPIYE